MSGDGEADGEVIFEVTRVGDAQRVAAIHVATGVEVVIQAPANAALVDVRTVVLRKLRLAIAGKPASLPPVRPGKLV